MICLNEEKRNIGKNNNNNTLCCTTKKFNRKIAMGDLIALNFFQAGIGIMKKKNILN